MIASVLVLGSVGCVGDELGTGDDVPHPLDDDNGEDSLDGSTAERILDFAEASSETLETAAAAMDDWKEDTDDADLDAIDQLRIDATGHLNTYDSIVAPNRSVIAELETGAEIDGTEWPADGEALAAVLAGHEPMLFRIEEASIAVVDADGRPEGIAPDAADAIEHIREDAEAIADRTRAALDGEAAG